MSLSSKRYTLQSDEEIWAPFKQRLAKAKKLPSCLSLLHTYFKCTSLAAPPPSPHNTQHVGMHVARWLPAPSPACDVIGVRRRGGGAEVSCPNILPIACIQIKWFCPNITCLCMSWNCYLITIIGGQPPPPPPPALYGPYAYGWRELVQRTNNGLFAYVCYGSCVAKYFRIAHRDIIICIHVLTWHGFYAEIFPQCVPACEFVFSLICLMDHGECSWFFKQRFCDKISWTSEGSLFGLHRVLAGPTANMKPNMAALRSGIGLFHVSVIMLFFSALVSGMNKPQIIWHCIYIYIISCWYTTFDSHFM